MLILAYLYYNATPQAGPSPHDLDLLKTGLFSLCLFASSFTIWRAEAGLRNNNQRRMVGWLARRSCSAAFSSSARDSNIGDLFQSGVDVNSNLFATTFFTLTGFHGLHVCVGLIALLIVLGLALAGDFKKRPWPALEAVGLYWHFVDVVWVLVLSVVYILPRLR